MELKQSTVGRASHQPQVLVRVGNQQWVMGRAAREEDSPMKKVVGLPSATMRLPRAESKTNRMREPRLGWMRLQKLFINVLDTLVDPSASPTPEENFQSFQTIFDSTRSRRGVSTRGSFQVGLIFGLVLGCISLILFHQLEPTYSTQARQTVVQAIAEPSSGPAIVLPAVRLHVLQSSVLSSETYAKIVQRKLNGHGIRSAIQHTTNGYTLLYQVAAYSADLLKGHQRLAGVGYRSDIRTFQWNTTELPTLEHLSRPGAVSISRWLSNEISALNALTATISDGAPAADAFTAMKTAKQSQPSREVISASGYQDGLRTFSASIDHAFSLCQQHHSDAAMAAGLSAYSELYHLMIGGSRPAAAQ